MDTKPARPQGRGRPMITSGSTIVPVIDLPSRDAMLLGKKKRKPEKEQQNYEALKSEIDEANLVFLPRRPRSASFGGSYSDREGGVAAGGWEGGGPDVAHLSHSGEKETSDSPGDANEYVRVVVFLVVVVVVVIVVVVFLVVVVFGFCYCCCFLLLLLLLLLLFFLLLLLLLLS
jgi:hypothetical protein